MSREDRQNNFDLLRLALAAAVFLVHAQVLSDEDALGVLPRYLSALVAVQAFFVISGFLVFPSFERSSSLRHYAEKRVRRVYPAYITVVLATALGGVFLSELPVRDYFSMRVVAFLAANLTFLNFLAPTLPGVFTHNPLPAVNGALWTLKVEVLFYAAVPLIVALWSRIGRAVTLAAGYVLSVAYVYTFEHLAESTGQPVFAELARQLPGQLAYFLAGAACYVYLPLLRRFWAPLLAASLVVFWLRDLPAVRIAAAPAALAIMVSVIAVVMPPLRRGGEHADLSYGTYLWHFPLLQTLIAAGWFLSWPWLSLAGAAVLLAALAALSWHLIERPALKENTGS